MNFVDTRISGVFLIDIQPRADDRGFFSRVFCRNEFVEHGLNPAIAQQNVAYNRRRGTLRGMHFQFPPKAETKIVRCTRGAILDIVVDLRPESPTYLQHVAAELTAGNRRAIYVPERFAHGYQVLEDDTETTYLCGEFYAPEHESGLHYADPRLRLEWPLPVTMISPKDAAARPLAEVEPYIIERMTLAGEARNDPR
jgi:dTDP-4-dehydrorhamnose 3,5-epimerase